VETIQILETALHLNAKDRSDNNHHQAPHVAKERKRRTQAHSSITCGPVMRQKKATNSRWFRSTGRPRLHGRCMGGPARTAKPRWATTERKMRVCSGSLVIPASMAEFPSRWGAGNASKSFNQPNLLELPSHLIDSAVSMRSVICGVSANILYLARCRKHQMRSVQPCDAMPGFGQHWIRLVTLKRSVD
jgi:hypothetical protein